MIKCRSEHKRKLPVVATLIACWIVVPLSAAVLYPAFAADPAQGPPVPAPSLDDTLLQDLDNELLEGAGDPKQPTRPDGRDGEPPGEGTARPVDPDQVIDDTMPAEDADPLVHISQEMRTVEEWIPQSARRSHAEQVQQRILDDLARLIEQAENQRAQSSSSQKKSSQSRSTAERRNVQQPQKSRGNSGKDSNQPAQDSTDRMSNAAAARPDPELFRGMLKNTWGHLPARDREQVLQNTPDKFVPQYELLIEKYYRRLAEEQEPK
jgi:hypothetical protein